MVSATVMDELYRAKHLHLSTALLETGPPRDGKCEPGDRLHAARTQSNAAGQDHVNSDTVANYLLGKSAIGTEASHSPDQHQTAYCHDPEEQSQPIENSLRECFKVRHAA